LTRDTHSYVAYFCNRATNDFASVCTLVTTHTIASYLEFSTSYTNGMTLETNTNAALPLTPADPQHRVFRFPRIQSAEALYAIHRQLMAKYATGCGRRENRKARKYTATFAWLRIMDRGTPE
jgi:hypothetical protein